MYCSEDFMVRADHTATVDEAGGRAGDVEGFAFRHALPHQFLGLGIRDAGLQFVFGSAGLNGELQQACYRHFPDEITS